MKRDRAEQQRRRRELASKQLVKLSRSSRKTELAEALQEMREETQAISELPIAGTLRAMIAASRGDTGAIEAPKREPQSYPAAPAPRREWNPGKGFAGSLRPEKVREGRVSFRDLQARARKAALQAMRSKQWSDEDRADCANSITLGVLSKAVETVSTDETNRLQRKRRKLYPLCSALNHYGYGSRETGAANLIADIPEQLATGLALYHRARDYRESREAGLAAEQKLSGGFSSGLLRPEEAELETEAPDLARYPIAALRFAWDSCEALGLPTTGETFSIAYTVARLNGGADSVPAVARELGMKPERLYSLLKRSHKYYPASCACSGETPEIHAQASYSLPSDCERDRHYEGTTFYLAYPDRKRVAGSMTPNHAAFMERLHILNNHEAGSRIAHGASELPEQWRGVDKGVPVYSIELKRTRKRLSVHPPQWAQALSPRQAEALRAASFNRRERAGLPTEQLAA